MSKKNEAWGIEVGQDAIKAVRLTRHGQDVHLDDYEVIRFKQILSTPDIDVSEQVQLHLDKLIQKHDLTHSTTVISVPGHKAFARFAKLPPVEPKKIPDIVKFEAVQQIPFPIDQVEWDYQVFQQEDSPDVEVGIFAITKERVAHFLSDFRAVNIRIDALTLSPLAVYNAFAFDQNITASDDGVILMDIGTVSTDVVIVENGRIWLRTLPIGGNAFTEALVRAFKISFPKAEKLKREAATSKYAKQIFQAMRGVFADLVQEVQRSLGYYQSLNRDSNVTKLIGVGSTFRLPGLTKFLKQQLQIEVIRPDGFEKISVEGKREADFAENALNLATAYGLALQGLGMQAVEANILPGAIMRTRMWKAKQPWLVAAAACVAVAATLMGVTHFTQKAAWTAAADIGGNTGTDIQYKRVENTAKRFKTEYDQFVRDEDPRQRIENLRRALDYRDLWPHIMADISGALNSLGTEPELLSNDFDAIQKIPRGQRRRIYIESIEGTYLPTPTAAGATAFGAGVEYDETGEPVAASVAGATEYFNASTGQAPTIQIKIVGWTPYNSPEDLLQSTFVRHLRSIKDRPDRPYTLDFSSNVLTHLTNRVVVRDPAQAGLGGEFAARGQAPSSTDLKSVDALLPTNPLSAEPATGDFEFHLVWRVKLKPPAESRGSSGAPSARQGGQSLPADDTAQPQAGADGAGEQARTTQADKEAQL